MKKVPISCYRNGFPRPVVFKELRDEYGYDGRLPEHGHSRRNLLRHFYGYREREEAWWRTFLVSSQTWAEQPEASFLLKRARESTPNRETVAVAIVDHEPTHVELRDNRLDYLIYRPISAPEADAVLQ